VTKKVVGVFCAFSCAASVEKGYFYSGFLWKKSGFKAVNDVSFKLYEAKH
jgi:hypothetical protein